MKQIVIFPVFLCFLFLQTSALAAPSLETQVTELTKMVREMRQMMAAQQIEINALKEITKSAVSIAPPAANTQQRPPSASSGRWNPDIGVVGDIVFQHDSPKTDAEGADRVSVRELELLIGSFVDPYSRMDVNIAFSDFEDVEIQEAYLTRFGLPLETTARIGRSKPKVGKALLSHRDNLDTADYPLAIQRYFGLDGLNKTGVDLTKPLDLPLDSAHEITAGVIEGGNGEGGSAFGDSRRRPTVYSHVKNFWDLSDVTNFELGGTHMTGSQDADAGMETNVLGLDGTLVHFYGTDQRVKLQNELFYLNKKESLDENALGAYSLLDVRLNKRWSTGFRFDVAELVSDASVNQSSDYGYSGYITFFQSEFAKWRVQFNRVDSKNGKDDNQVLIQGIFAIGEHKHKLQ